MDFPLSGIPLSLNIQSTSKMLSQGSRTLLFEAFEIQKPQNLRSLGWWMSRILFGHFSSRRAGGYKGSRALEVQILEYGPSLILAGSVLWATI